MTAFRQNVLILIFVFIHSAGKTQQACEDSVQSYSLYSSYKIEHIGGSFVRLQNGYTANTAYVYTPSGRKLAIILTDKDGQFVRAKYLELVDPTYTLGLSNLIEAPGNAIIGYGRLLTSGGNEKGISVIKFDNALSIQWSNLFRRSLTEPETGFYRTWGLHCDDQSNVYFSFNNIPNIVIPPKVIFVSLDITGAIRWSKGIDDRSLPSSALAFNAVTTIDNKAFFIGGYQAVDKPGLIGLSVDKNSGSFLKMISGNLNTGGNVTLSTNDQNIRLWPGNKNFYYAFGEETISPKHSNLIRVLIDTSLTMSHIQRIKGMIWAYSWRQFSLGKDGSLSFLGHDNPVATSITTDHFAVIDSATNIRISKKIGNNFFTRPDLFPILIKADGKSISLSVSNQPALDSIKRIDIPLDGDTSLYSCLGKDSSFFSIESTSLQRNDLNPGTVYTNVAQSSPLSIFTSDFIAQKKEFCKVKSICRELKVISDSLFCIKTPQLFIARKNPECLKKIEWNLDNVPASMVNQTDTSITLQFNAPWNGIISAGLKGCGLSDSHIITVKQPLNSFTLGDEKTICKGDSVLLSALIGYPHYEWNTGDTTASIKTSVAGSYTVSITDFCGNTVSSSILVKNPEHSIPPINNEAICKGDSVLVSLPPYFTNINWTPQIRKINDTTFFLNPAINTTYLIQARDEYDCQYKSSFDITVNTCSEKIWIPDAFTPNDDKLNDQFGAVVDGRFRSFHLAVYNRWGEVVFSTTDPKIKWDGRFKGISSPSGIYIWVCNYQFTHGATVNKKGTVMLIH